MNSFIAQLYVDGSEVGRTHAPLPRPTVGNDTGWKVSWKQTVVSDLLDGSQSGVRHSAPFIVVGCDFDRAAWVGGRRWETEFRDHAHPGTAFDELAMWTRALRENKTHNEIDYFLGGYGKYTHKMHWKLPFWDLF